MKSKMKFLNELDEMNLPNSEYVIFGSGPLSIRGLRENHDIDILVTNKLWKDLKKRYPVKKKKDRPDSIYIGNLQFLTIGYRDWGEELPDQSILIDDAEIIGKYPFVKLEYLLCCKKQMDDEKHKNDIKLIESLLEKQNK